MTRTRVPGVWWALSAVQDETARAQHQEGVDDANPADLDGHGLVDELCDLGEVAPDGKDIVSGHADLPLLVAALIGVYQRGSPQPGATTSLPRR